MNTLTFPAKLNRAPLSWVSRAFGTHRLGFSIKAAVIVMLAGLVAGGFYVSSSASGVKSSISAPVADSSVSARNADVWPATGTSGYAAFLPVPTPTPVPVTVATYESNCSTPKTVFNIQDTDKTVCAKVTGAQTGWSLIWSNANNVAVQNVSIGSANFSNSFTLTLLSNVGDWRVIVFDPFGGTVQAVTSFTVVDNANPVADLSVDVASRSSQAAANAQVLFGVQVSNFGPNAATNVSLTDAVPDHTKFKSFAQLTGPLFECTSPAEGATGTTTCTIATLDRGETATFVATYTVDNDATAGTEILNQADVSSGATADQNIANNSSSASVNVFPAPCVLSCPSNITQAADSGQAGAIVTYSTPGSTGDCGTATTGEGGEVIPVISCNQPSGSFFPVGTSTVICSAQTGDACTFQVTIDNPGGLSISLNGANTIAVECGADFNDPGASAVNGVGQSVPVVITDPQGFNPDGPAVGSYTITYTATEGQNSVSTTRTVNVSDNEAPSITVQGANPYKIQQGSCAAFSDPGATASDGCAGPKPVTTSTSGPGGATSVNPATPGTYTITYTATDGTHQKTATRTVLVGNFPEDEVDQPASANVPPTITLTCPTGVDDCSQTTIECGDTFTDLGATASVCGGSVPVTTSGTVDRHTPGTYSITYTATANGLTTTATRSVTVQPDNTAPTIELTGANPIYVECHTGTFTDPGAIAHDACAGDFPAIASGSVDVDVVGTYTITYNATDPSGHMATPVGRSVIVRDTTPPTVTAPANVTVYTGSGATSCSSTVSNATLGTGSANDACAGSLSVTRTGVPAGNVFPVGSTTITYSANDGFNTGTATQTVTVLDNTAPTITTNGQTLSMWPPNHKYQTFQVTNFVTGASDNCTTLGVGDVVIEKVTSDETENGNGDGNTANDIVIAADCKSLQLRSERDGGGDGRVYTITFKVTDASGNVGRATAKVVVAHNPGQTPVDSGAHYTVNGTCP